MAYTKSRKSKSGRKKKRYGPKTVHVKGHTRTPRGPNAGKKAVHVKGHRRRDPRS